MKLYQCHIRFFRALIKTLIMVLVVASGVAGSAWAESSSFFRPYPTIDSKKWYISSGWTNGDHQSCEWREDAVSGVKGNLQLRLSDKGGKLRPIGCAEIHTNDRTGFGRYEARMRSAAGSGLNTAFFTYVGPPTGSHEHDEIDFEFIGTEPNTVDITVWTNGKSSGAAKRIPLGFDASEDEPLNALAVTEAGFARAGALIGALKLPTTITQEGGYNTAVLGPLLARFLGAWGNA